MITFQPNTSHPYTKFFVRKLLEKQKKEKEKEKAIGKVNILQDAFIRVLKSGD